ncbi:MAG: type II toxin-antitoxin system RelE/ParE family toxin [Clostridia bacterium]|nr:type II toxin-antitoxin system RelE/ParE family toxin [Clostridia bacterium]
MEKKYRLRYLKLAQSDLLDMVSYISGQLHAPQAATELIDKLDKAISQLEEFPFSGRPYQAKRTLEDEYRILVVENYLVFYTVQENEGIVEIRRIIYGKRNYERLL